MKPNIAILSAALLFVPSLALADDTIPEKRPTNIVVHVATEDAVLRSHTTNGFDIECTAPCDRALPADVEYRLDSHGSTTAPFTLQRDTLKVAVGMTPAFGSRTGALALTIIGGVGAIFGATLLAYGAADHIQYGVTANITEVGVLVAPTSKDVGQYHDVMITGGITAGIGVATLVAGLVLFAATKRPQLIQTTMRF